jgi:hypothetical protein
MSTHPPKPPLALAVGVVGHRPDRLPQAAVENVAAEVAKFLAALARETRAAGERHADIFAPGPPRLSLLSALAEGADRIAAEAALANGFMLDVPLPFAAATYEADFATPESRDRFHDLLGRARSVLALPGAREAEARAYEAVGLTVLSQADILLAIWDGGPSAGRGGTTDILTFAARAGIPIVHIDAKAAASPRVLWSGLSEVPSPADAIADVPAARLDEALPQLVKELVRPPLAAAEQAALRRYLQERAHGHNFRIELPLLMTALRVQPVRKTDMFPPTPDRLAVEYAAFAAEAEGGDMSALAQAYGWADAIGVQFAQTFRGAFVLNFLFAAFAVVLAVTSILGHEKFPFIFPEIALILAVVINTAVGRHQRWHQRWLEAREVAERLRVALPLWALGVRPSTFFSGEEPTWIGWYARAVVRAQGPRSGALDAKGLEAARSVLAGMLRNQCGFHERSEHRMHRLEHRLERLGLLLFLATLFTAGLYVLFALALKIFHCSISEESYEFIKHVVVALTAGLPALATATYGIRVIGDFEGVAKRSARTRAALDRLVETAERDPLDLGTLRVRARTAADAMLGDVENWRLAAESRTLAIPG